MLSETTTDIGPLALGIEAHIHKNGWDQPAWLFYLCEVGTDIEASFSHAGFVVAPLSTR